MGKLVDWNDTVGGNSQKTNTSGTVWAKIVSGKTHVFRPVGKPIRFYRITKNRDGKWYSVIVDDPDDNIIKQNYDMNANMRYAINVFDREDGQLKVYEFPPKVYSFLRQIAKISKSEPGGKDGCDISIKRDGTGKSTNYTLDVLDVAPFTDAEKARVRAQKDADGNIVSGGLYNLEEIFKTTPEDKLEQYLFGKSSEAEGGDSNQSTEATVVPEATPDVDTSSAVSQDDIDKDLGF